MPVWGSGFLVMIGRELPYEKARQPFTVSFPTPKMFTTVLFMFCSSLCLIYILLRLRRKTRWRMPPGPAPGLFGDNRWDVPFYQPWRRYTEWHSLYGELSMHIIRYDLLPLTSLVLQVTLSPSGWAVHPSLVCITFDLRPPGEYELRNF